MGIFTWAAAALGFVALGGVALGVVASGGVAIGVLAEGLVAIAPASSPVMLQSFLAAPRWMMMNMGVLSVLYSLSVASVAGALSAWKSRKHERLNRGIFG